jgi:short-chain fatty acids transporter
MAISLTDATVIKILTGWFGGYLSFFTFSFQVLLLFMGGLVLVDAPLVQRGVLRLARSIHSPTGAYISLIILSNVSMWCNIYVSVVVSSVFGRYIGRNVKGVDYRLLIAIAYSSLAIWHTGISGTIPLTINTPKNPFFELMGSRLYPLSETIFTPMNLVAAFGILLSAIIAFGILLRPKKGDEVRTFEYYLIDPANDIDGGIKDEKEEKEDQKKTFAEYIETFRPISVLLGVGMISYCTIHFSSKGILSGLELNSLAFLLYGFALILHKSPKGFLKSFSSRFGGMSSIALQFPLYGGIMGMMMATGLAGIIAGWFIAISTVDTFALWTFLASGFINFFVPSGGGHFAVQAPMNIVAAKTVGADLARTSMAIAYGNTWTDLIQPFWTLLYLPIMGQGLKINIKDFMGFSFIYMFIVGVVYALCLHYLTMTW